MFSNPYVFQYTDYLFKLPVVEELFTVGDAILRNQAIIQFGVDGVNTTLGADKWVAKILCGTLAGSGGGIWIGRWKQKTKIMNVQVPQGTCFERVQ